MDSSSLYPSPQRSLENAGVIDNILQNTDAPRLLDVGTCLGQDIRALLHEGAPKRTLYGTDIFSGFEEIGHELFLDEQTFTGRFFPADVFSDDPTSPLNTTAGLWDVVSATMFTHQFDLNRQRFVARRMIRLLRHRKGSAIIGTSTGQLKATAVPLRPPFCRKPGDETMYRQNKETMSQLWTEALTSCGEDLSSWKVICEYDEKQVKKREQEQREHGEVRFFKGDDQRRIFFWVQRV